jgi:hypothetical protein
MVESLKDDFARAAKASYWGGFLSEIWYFIRRNKKWWLIPLIIPLLVMGAFMILAGTGAAPLIYTLF